jgi:hypothetical protein
VVSERRERFSGGGHGMDVPESSPQEERREEDSPRAGGGHRMVVHGLADREIGAADLDHGIGVSGRQRQAVGLVPGPLGPRRITL